MGAIFLIEDARSSAFQRAGHIFLVDTTVNISPWVVAAAHRLHTTAKISYRVRTGVSGFLWHREKEMFMFHLLNIFNSYIYCRWCLVYINNAWILFANRSQKTTVYFSSHFLFLFLCFLRCTECHRTLLHGSYKLESNSGALVCAHHLNRNALSNQNGQPDLSKRPASGQSARTGRSTVPHTAPSDGCQAKTPVQETNDSDVPADDSVTVAPVTTSKDGLEKTNEDSTSEAEEKPRSATPPNPFDESDDEEEEGEKEEEETQTPAKHTANGDLPSTPHVEVTGRPVPAPRRVSDPIPPPRPVPRARLSRTADGPAVGK